MASSRKSPSTEARKSPATGEARQAPDIGALPAALEQCLARHVLPGQRIVLGLSGGIDSVSLLHALAAEARDSAWTLAALHVHHGLSPHADAWEGFCRDACARLRVEFDSVRVCVERNAADGLEAAARRARHSAFAAAAGDWIMLAQHRDDQAETLLFNLLRGAGLAGAAAMCERNGRLLRPLLGLGRDAIAAYAAAHALAWVDDESNADIRHTRNFLRLRILPELEGRFPAAAKNLAGASLRFAAALDLLDELACADLGTERDFPLSLARLQGLSETRAGNALRYLLARRQVMIPSEARLREALRQMREAGPDRHPALRFGAYRLLRRRGYIYLESAEG